MAAKKIVLILSKTFPLIHSKKRKETGYKEAFLNGRKIHTIRSNYDRWNHNIDKIQNGDLMLSLREWAGKPYNS
ncbi:MAG: hypothetical protein GX567_04185 [Clostridia bacterium]|nr:hypothetical protein [Clostridia bacterium]